MNRRELMLAGMALGVKPAFTAAQQERASDEREQGQEAPPGSPPTILLNDYLPHSLYRVPVTEVDKAKFPVVDAHNHGHGPINVADMVKIMDQVGVEKTVIF